jgi:HK97 family phage major capsid protein
MGAHWKREHWEKKDAGGAVPAEIKALFDGLRADLATLRTKHDEEMKEVKSKGSADVVVRDQVKRVEAGVDKLKGDIDTLFKKASRPTIAGDAKSVELETKANLEVAAWIGADGDAAKGAAARVAYKAAFAKMVRRGRDALSPDEVKTLSVASAPDGGFYVEPQRADFIVQRLRETSRMRNIASVQTITAPSLKIPIDRDDVGFEWVGEQSTRNPTNTAQTGELEIPVHELSAMPKVTQNMLDDQGFDVEGWINQKIVDRFGRGENTAFVNGNGTSRPKGFLTGTPTTVADAARPFGTLQYIFTGVSGAFATASPTVSPADKMLDLIYAFNAGYRSSLTWTMNKTTLGAVRKFKDQQGNYIYDPRLSANGVIDMVLGYPVEEFADLADFTVANAFAIALGDFKRGYLIVDKQGMRQLRDPYTDKPRVLFYTTKRVGGAVVDSDAIKLLKFGTS